MRKQNWPELLKNGIESWKEIPFQWGTADCVQFAYRVAAEYVDYDLPERLGAVDFTDEYDAQKYFMREYGGKLENIFDRALKRRPSALHAQQGDIVIAQNENQDISGIVAPGGRFVAVKAKKGLFYLPFSAVKTAWAVE